MKKLKFLAVAAVLFLSVSATAQTKIGYIRIDDVVSLMPELNQKKINIDTIGAQFVKDSIVPEIEYKQAQLEQKTKDLNDTTKPKSVREIIYKEFLKLQEELSGADQFVQQVLQMKQQQFLSPYYVKARNAVQAVAKKKGYTHVLGTDSFLVAPDTDNLFADVLKELNIPMPKPNAAGGN